MEQILRTKIFAFFERIKFSSLTTGTWRIPREQHVVVVPHLDLFQFVHWTSSWSPISISSNLSPILISSILSPIDRLCPLQFSTVDTILDYTGTDLDVNKRGGMSRASALHWASKSATSCKIVERLLRIPNIWGRALEDVDLDRKTPLHYAAEFGNLEVCDLLLRFVDWRGGGGGEKRAALVRAQDKDGKTAGQLAAGNGFAAVAKLLELGERRA